MFKSLSLVKKTSPIIENTLARSYATKVALKLKGSAAKDLANDGTGNHTHVATQTCIQNDCSEKKCPSLCDQPKETSFKGHNTHKPPIGRMCRHISEEDAKGQKKSQYFVKTNKKVEITEQEKQNYGSNIKYDSVQQVFIDKNKDKYD